MEWVLFQMEEENDKTLNAESLLSKPSSENIAFAHISLMQQPQPNISLPITSPKRISLPGSMVVFSFNTHFLPSSDEMQYISQTASLRFFAIVPHSFRFFNRLLKGVSCGDIPLNPKKSPQKAQLKRPVQTDGRKRLKIQ